MADLLSNLAIVPTALYGVVSFATFLASLVATGQASSFARHGCMISFGENSDQAYVQTAPCDFTTWLVYAFLAAASFLATYVAALVVIRHDRSDSLSWRPIAYGVTFSLVGYLAVFHIGWGAYIPIIPSIDGLFVRDWDAASLLFEEIEWSPDYVIPSRELISGLASARASIILGHIALLVGAIAASTAFVAKEPEPDEDAAI